MCCSKQGGMACSRCAWAKGFAEHKSSSTRWAHVLRRCLQIGLAAGNSACTHASRQLFKLHARGQPTHKTAEPPLRDGRRHISAQGHEVLGGGCAARPQAGVRRARGRAYALWRVRSMCGSASIALGNARARYTAVVASQAPPGSRAHRACGHVHAQQAMGATSCLKPLRL